ncbi:MAG: AraC family transcriptional regulator [Lachnospiraceae bacterium]|nr:AraC family transcriptional regulator [Lachnospiraceae bacterium]
MDWITGMQSAIDYIENHITEELDYDSIAARGFSSSYHFQRIFSLLCGMTLGEYIRNRRLSLAGAELAAGKIKVIDAALKYGYESPDSFAKAFHKFHGISPSAARMNGSSLKSFSRLTLKISLEGGSLMDYRIEEKEEMLLTGFKTHFTGAPYGKEREAQEEELFATTRGKQWFLSGAASAENKDAHCVMTNITDEGYDYYYCHVLDSYEREELYNHAVTGVDFVEELALENIALPRTTYIIFETKDGKNTIPELFELLGRRVQILTEWMPDLGFELADGPELVVYHWMPREERKTEVWMPVKKCGMKTEKN